MMDRDREKETLNSRCLLLSSGGNAKFGGLSGHRSFEAEAKDRADCHLAVGTLHQHVYTRLGARPRSEQSTVHPSYQVRSRSCSLCYRISARFVWLVTQDIFCSGGIVEATATRQNESVPVGTLQNWHDAFSQVCHEA